MPSLLACIETPIVRSPGALQSLGGGYDRLTVFNVNGVSGDAVAPILRHVAGFCLAGITLDHKRVILLVGHADDSRDDSEGQGRQRSDPSREVHGCTVSGVW